MPVSDQHKLYTVNRPKWELVRDCVEGSQAVKNRSSDIDTSTDKNAARSLRGTRYLPQPNPDDFSQENRIRYEQYKARASFVNFTGHTEDGFLGMVYRKMPETELSTNIAFLDENADGAGMTLLQMLQATTADVMETGRHGILTDFPPSPGGTQAQTMHLQAMFIQYEAETIVNWRTRTIDGQNTVILVVLAEQVEKRVDGDDFAVETVTWHRVLTFNGQGEYIQQLYNEDDELIFHLDDAGEFFSDIVPKKADGKPWRNIPFVFIGAKDNTPTPDKAPLYDMAEINVAHYRNSADFEESSFQIGNPTPWFSGLTQAWVDNVMKGGVEMGPRRAVLLPENGGAGLLQANENNMGRDKR